ncbi:MAG: GatB/YqeY domain-containing protein [Planctomycetota bacterium]|nr:MAG: GatB/YqeY domain-containing protein [Planctomycetota bacterium]
MMGVRETLDADLKTAMRGGDTLSRDTLRMVLAGVKNKRIEVGEDLSEEQVLAVLASAVKSRKDSAAQFDEAGRPELAVKERAEIDVIERYLPQQLSEAETRTLVEGLVGELGITTKRELGKLMKAVMAEHRGRVDGKLVQRFAGELLDS